jgi:hypothetical protein
MLILNPLEAFKVFIPKRLSSVLKDEKRKTLVRTAIYIKETSSDGKKSYMTFVERG